MPQIFKRTTNAISRLTIFGGVFIVGAVAWAWATAVWSPYVTAERIPLDQPVPFSHAHHVGGLGIDCRYCHPEVERSSFAGIPPTSTCMNCHKQVWSTSDMLEPVRASLRDNRPLRMDEFMSLVPTIIFVSATLLGFASSSPGGLGVFDAAMLVALIEFEREELLAGLLLFRLLYYVVPFALSLLILVSALCLKCSSKSGAIAFVAQLPHANIITRAGAAWSSIPRK